MHLPANAHPSVFEDDDLSQGGEGVIRPAAAGGVIPMIGGRVGVGVGPLHQHGHHVEQMRPGLLDLDAPQTGSAEQENCFKFDTQMVIGGKKI